MTDDLLFAAAARFASRVAVRDGADSWTYAELAETAGRMAGGLVAAGAGHGARVGLLAAPSIDAVAAIHAVRLAGGLLVPLDRRLPGAALAGQLRRSGVRLLVHDAASSPAAAAATDASEAGTDEVGALGLASLSGTARPHADPGDVDRPVAIVSTSGTTGTPKGALLTAANLLASAQAWNATLGATGDDPWLLTLPLNHVAGLGIVVRAALAGAAIHVHERFDPGRVAAALEHERIAFVSLVPSQLSAVLDLGHSAPRALRAVLLGGASAAPALIRRAVAAGLPVMPTYGLTEAASGVTALPAPEAAVAPGSSGRPLPGVRLRIDGDAVSGGEVLVQGPMVFAGYDRDPAATARALDADGWLHTGDIGMLDADGRLTVLDRRDDLIVSGGENVSPVQVEAVLAEHHAVADIAVVGRDHARWGRVPVAAVVPMAAGAGGGAGSAWTLALELLAHARSLLPPYAVPAGVAVVDAVPRTPSGKILRPDVATRIRIGPTIEVVRRPDGARLVVRRRGSGPTLVLSHATLSTATELDPLAERLAERFTVLAVDRRTAGAGMTEPGWEPRAVDVDVHVADLLAALEAAGLEGPALGVGHSYGGCVTLEAVARHGDRFAGAWVFEPPYVPAAPAPVRRVFAGLGRRVATIGAEQGLGEAAIAFLSAVAGEAVVARLPEPALDAMRAEGRSAVADAGLAGLDLAGLERMTRPVEIATGGRSHPWYEAIARGIAGRVPDATLLRLDDLNHGGPIGRPDDVAAAIVAFAARHGILRA